MAHINDLKRDALLSLTGESSGHISDLEHAWLMTNLSYTGDYHINDLWRDYLIAEGVTPTDNLNDMQMSWLGTLGYTGTLNDRFHAMWEAGGPFLPSSLSGLQLWTRFNTDITVTGSGVSQWDDQSGNGNHLLQATDADRPSKELDGSILFDGAGQRLKTSAFTLNQPETIYILCKQVSWTDVNYFFDGNAQNSGALVQSGTTPTIKIYAGTALVADNTDLIINTYEAIASILNGASSILQVGSNSPTGPANPGAGNMGGFTLADRGTAAANSGNIQVKECIIYNTAHDAATRSKVISYLQGL